MTQHEQQRRAIWIQAWSAVASAWNSKEADVATKWADKALKAFDERFPAPAERNDLSQHALKQYPTKSIL